MMANMAIRRFIGTGQFDYDIPQTISLRVLRWRIRLFWLEIFLKEKIRLFLLEIFLEERICLFLLEIFLKERIPKIFFPLGSYE